MWVHAFDFPKRAVGIGDDVLGASADWDSDIVHGSVVLGRRIGSCDSGAGAGGGC